VLSLVYLRGTTQSLDPPTRLVWCQIESVLVACSLCSSVMICCVLDLGHFCVLLLAGKCYDFWLLAWSVSLSCFMMLSMLLWDWVACLLLTASTNTGIVLMGYVVLLCLFSWLVYLYCCLSVVYAGFWSLVTGTTTLLMPFWFWYFDGVYLCWFWFGLLVWFDVTETVTCWVFVVLFGLAGFASLLVCWLVSCCLVLFTYLC
jgi:hypothetical protein